MFRDAFPLFAIALAIRIALIFHPGHVQDFQIFSSWAEKGAEYGVVEMYDPRVPGHMTDYPPVMLYLYTGVGHLIGAIQGDQARTMFSTAMVKLPGILGDFALAAVMILIGRRTIGRRRGVIAATLYLLLPASWLDSAVWGQVDSVVTLLVLVAFVALAMKRPWIAGSAAGLAVCTKYQALAFLPLLAAIALVIDWRLLTKAVVATVGAATAVLMPFIIAGNFSQVAAAYSRAVGAYSVLSANAFNLWRIGFGDAASSIPDTQDFAGLSYRNWGFVMFASALTIVIVLTSRMLASARDDDTLRLRIVLASAAVLSLAFFMFPTQIHERYLFPFLALGAFFATRGWIEMLTYLTISAGIALNIAYRLSISAAELLYRAVPGAERLIAIALLASGVVASVMIFYRVPLFPAERAYR